MPTTIPAITALPTAPLRSDPSTFPARAEDMLVAQETVFVPQLNAMRTAMNTLATELSASETNAEAQVALAADQAELATTNGAVQVVLATNQAVIASNAATAASNSALAAGASVWVSGVTYSIGDAKYSPVNFQTYRRKTAGAGTTDPSLDSTNWADITALPDRIGNTGKFLQTDGVVESWQSLLPSQTSNNGKFLQTNGTTTVWAFAGISQVTTATTATTLTSTPTLLQITPTSYGVTVTLPDATTCSVGGPLHCIDNRGAFPVRVCNSAGTLLGFVFAGVVSYIALDDKSTAAGVWAISSNELVGASAQLLTTNIVVIRSVIDIGSSQEVIIATNASAAAVYGVVYNRATNTFGAVTLIRSALSNGYATAVLSGANQVLVASCDGAAAFEAVTLTISGTTITVNTAATATLSANMNGFADGCGLIAVGSSFVTSYTVATPAAQIRALSISGTTVTIGAASVLSGTAGGLQAAATNHIVTASTASLTIYVKPYLVSGSTLTAGTEATFGGGAATSVKLAPLGTRWFLGHINGSSNIMGSVVSLNSTGNGTITLSTVGLTVGSSFADAIIIGSNKVLVLDTNTSSNANILTDTAGTASAGTAITLSTQTVKACLYASGTDVAVQEGTTNYLVHMVDCSGASPVRTSSISTGTVTNSYTATFGTSNAVLNRSVRAVYGTAFAQTIFAAVGSPSGAGRVSKGVFTLVGQGAAPQTGNVQYRGKSDSERWVTDATTVITKVECVA